MEISSSVSVYIEVYVDSSLCKGCGLCVDMCSMGVFSDNHAGIYPEKSHLCVACFKCNDFCPENAINTRYILRA
jgi:2-oxoglutarate ferredoxin oxidoreductase subunit delta